MITAVMLALLPTQTLELRVPKPEIVISLSDKKRQTCPLVFANNSGDSVDFWTTTFWINHQLGFRGSDGTDVALTDLGIKAVLLFGSPNRDNNVKIVVKPGKKFSYKTPKLPEFYVLKPGTYTLYVTYSDSNSKGPLQLTTPVTAVRVTE